MITCQHARQLFDRYLDDELSPSLQAELHAHLLQCSDCQNELALMEACGDVVRLDRCEPALSGSFADRVMGLHHQQVVHSRRQKRLVLWIGAPVAAAASIALAFLWMAPAFGPEAAPVNGTVTAAVTTAAPKEFQKNLLDITGTQLSDDAREELASTPEMQTLPFLEAVLSPLVEGTRSAMEGTRRSYQDVSLLVRYGFAGMNERLVAEFREQYPEDTIESTPAGRVLSDLSTSAESDFLEPAFLSQELSAQEPANAAGLPADRTETPASGVLTAGRLPEAI